VWSELIPLTFGKVDRLQNPIIAALILLTLFTEQTMLLTNILLVIGVALLFGSDGSRMRIEQPSKISGISDYTMGCNLYA
jgi:hypothetical protein